MRGKDKSCKRAPQGSGWCQLGWGFRPHPRIPEVSLLRRQMPESNSSDRRNYVHFGWDSAGSGAVHSLTKDGNLRQSSCYGGVLLESSLKHSEDKIKILNSKYFVNFVNFVHFVHFVHLCRLPRLSPILKSRANIGKFPSSFTSRGRFFLKRFKFTLKCDNFAIFYQYKLTVKMVSTFQISHKWCQRGCFQVAGPGRPDVCGEKREFMELFVEKCVTNLYDSDPKYASMCIENWPFEMLDDGPCGEAVQRPRRRTNPLHS